MSHELISVEQRGRVGVITLNRPKQLNALSPELMAELGRALAALDGDAGTGAIVITGNGKAFAAGADIAAMKDLSYMHAYLTDYITDWEHFRKVRKPVIAAVAGYALGGGNELAMQCDIVNGRGARRGRKDRQLFASRGDDDQGVDQPGLRDFARGRRALRAARVPVAVRAGGPEGRDGGFPREAQSVLQAPLRN
jgi:1,4-dihydroxy-2-naphthoyl-CoA synthase